MKKAMAVTDNSEIFEVDQKSAKMVNAKAQYSKKKENQKNFLKLNIIIKFIKLMIIKIL